MVLQIQNFAQSVTVPAGSSADIVFKMPTGQTGKVMMVTVTMSYPNGGYIGYYMTVDSAWNGVAGRYVNSSADLKDYLQMSTTVIINDTKGLLFHLYDTNTSTASNATVGAVALVLPV